MRRNLFRGLSRVILELARIPLPRIGSFTIDQQGYLSLSNRPLNIDVVQLENEQIPLDIPRQTTYERVEPYFSDILNRHERRLRYQPNAINDLRDGELQTCALTVMRSVWPCFFERHLARGPFFLNLTDLSTANIFVDEQWNITSLIDLEWACSHPVEMIHPPHWLTNDSIDGINKSEFEKLHAEFMSVLIEEEGKLELTFPISSIMQKGWETGTFWCSLALRSPTGLFSLFYDYIQPFFTEDNEENAWQVITPYWTRDTKAFIES